VNAFSETGKWSSALKTISSRKSLYTNFSMPLSMIKGDDLTIPITIYNLHNTAKKVKLTAIMEIKETN